MFVVCRVFLFIFLYILFFFIHFSILHHYNGWVYLADGLTKQTGKHSTRKRIATESYFPSAASAHKQSEKKRKRLREETETMQMKIKIIWKSKYKYARSTRLNKKMHTNNSPFWINILCERLFELTIFHWKFIRIIIQLLVRHNLHTVSLWIVFFFFKSKTILTFHHFCTFWRSGLFFFWLYVDRFIFLLAYTGFGGFLLFLSLMWLIYLLIVFNS